MRNYLITQFFLKIFLRKLESCWLLLKVR